LTNQVVKPKTLVRSDGLRVNVVNIAKTPISGLSARQPNKRSRINRSRYRRPAKHRFSGFPNFLHEEGVLRHSLPPLNALRSFDAAARHGSFTRAADELRVTQGAVSHQVKALEIELGLKLFNREHRGLVITEAGREYLSVVRDAFDRIALGTERLVSRQRSGALTVSASPDFAAKWLVNRLGRFADAHPRST
jgi:hypothetical protein